MTKQEQIEAIETRLHAGWERCTEKREWTDIWIELLRDYERLSDELAVAPRVQIDMGFGVRMEAAV